MAWKKPTDGYYKVNVTGVCDWDTKEASIGCVMRGDEGEYYHGFGGLMDGVGDPVGAALYAICFGLDLAWGKECKKLWLETDDSKVLRHVTVPDPEFKWWPLVGAINQLVGEKWESLVLDSVPPSVKGVAASMADYCHEEKLSPREFEYPPTPVKKVVDEELM